MSKKTIAAIAVGALVVALALPIAAFAAPYGGQGNRVAAQQCQGLGAMVAKAQGLFGQACGRAFVDADADGVCDNYAQGGRGQGYADADGDGVCDNYAGNANGTGRGQGYVDADGDGVCDNYGQGLGNGRGQGYVDADNDGVCDNYAQNGCGRGQGVGNGQGCGKHRRG